VKKKYLCIDMSPPSFLPLRKNLVHNSIIANNPVSLSSNTALLPEAPGCRTSPGNDIQSSIVRGSVESFIKAVVLLHIPSVWQACIPSKMLGFHFAVLYFNTHNKSYSHHGSPFWFISLLLSLSCQRWLEIQSMEASSPFRTMSFPTLAG
jgi:hypothetical protein